MKQLINILTILLSCIITVSCEQTIKSEKVNKTEKKIVENNYSKIISDSTNKLTNKIEKFEVQYRVWGCACPQWIKTKDTIKQNEEKTKYIDFHFYLQPADKSLELPIYFDAFRHFVKVEGQFYENKDYPQGTIEMEEPMPKAKVFRYTKYEIIDNPNFKPESKIETLTLTYNAISCTCAQWSEKKYADNPEKRVYYWLEPANDKLIKADELFNGENLPIIIKVTGQIITEKGFPKRRLVKVGEDKAGKVFRYTKIEIIKK
ncbi:hypothetical protein [Nubsella zeaxanthinifaciens]|jgi:hypothetical protein|uniref:hypothetical protein n=1 Tax=Nubsella zeaxanthinifaciens TaxID=392412 RepID=UPI000DE46FBB|nr:hypothetical protein [Nubsella zeaxanthinifaciens]